MRQEPAGLAANPLTVLDLAIASALAFVLALVCAAVVGFAAHRASLCNVRAVAQVLDTKSAPMLLGLVQAALWTMLLAGSLSLLGGFTLANVPMHKSIGWSLAGGLLFGTGAALNGGCSLSTLHRLANGELGMAATLLGFVLGVLLWATTSQAVSVETFVTAPPVWLRWPTLAPWLLLALGAWGLHRAAALLRLARTSSTAPWHSHILAPHWHPAAAAAAMGLATGLLYAAQGAWSYTNHLRTTTLHAWGRGPAPSWGHTALVGALILGMAGSALLRGPILWRRPWRLTGWARHASAGLLMGAGAAIVPGGNDTMLLSGLPTLVPQAVATYFALLVGIGVTLRFMRAARQPTLTPRS